MVEVNGQVMVLWDPVRISIHSQCDAGSVIAIWQFAE